MNKFLLSLVCSASMLQTVVANEIEQIAPAIINGTTANVDDYPYFASLYYDRKADNGQLGYMCGGTILDEQHILTAAHCVADSYSRIFMSVAIGVQNEDKHDRVEVVRANKFYVHSSYDPDINNFLLNDIAVIKLERPLEKYSLINQVTLPSKQFDRPIYRNIGTNMTIIGHGKNSPTGDTNVQFEHAAVNYTETCHDEWNVPQSQICFDSPVINGRFRSMCNGDSGGPLLWEKDGKSIQVGIASWMLIDCGNSNYANFGGVYTEVSEYTTWISNVLSGLEPVTYEVDESVRLATKAKETSSSSGGALGGIALFGLIIVSALRRKLTK